MEAKEAAEMTNKELIRGLVFIGCDGYYGEMWESYLNEISNRLDVNFAEILSEN